MQWRPLPLHTHCPDTEDNHVTAIGAVARVRVDIVSVTECANRLHRPVIHRHMPMRPVQTEAVGLRVAAQLVVWPLMASLAPEESSPVQPSAAAADAIAPPQWNAGKLCR